jgi:hypothetical protein
MNGNQLPAWVLLFGKKDHFSKNSTMTKAREKISPDM